MKDVRQAYIDAGSGFENDGAVLLFDYGPLLASFEYEIVVQHDDSDYQ